MIRAELQEDEDDGGEGWDKGRLQGPGQGQGGLWLVLT